MKSVLVVDDVEPVRELVCQVLRQQGFAVHAAADAEEAFQVLSGLGKLDLLLTDIELPGIKGNELFDCLHRRQPDLRVLFISGYSDEAVGGRLQAVGQFLAKPFTAGQLLQKVREVLGSSVRAARKNA